MTEILKLNGQDKKYALEEKYNSLEEGAISPSKDETPEKPTRIPIMIGIPHMGQIRAELGANYIQWASDPRFDAQILPLKGRRPVTVARNQLIKDFLESPLFQKCEYLLMIDSDMSGPPNLLELALFNKPIIGALTFMVKEGRIVPLALKRQGRGYSNITPLAANELVEVDATGTGCLMIRRDVFALLEKPYFEYLLDDEGLVQMGNDFYFCMKAKRAEIPIHVHTGYVTAHDQTVDIADLYFAQLKEEKERARKN